MSDTKIKFQVEGIQTIKNEMSNILKDVIEQTKLIDNSNKEFIKSLQQQIELLKERNKISSQFISGAIPQQQSDPGFSLTLKDLNSTLRDLVEKLEEDISPRSPRVRNEPSLNETQNTATGLNPKMLQSFALSNIINPMSSNDPINAGFGLLQNAGSSLMMMGGKAGIPGLAIALAASIGKMQVDLLRDIEPSASRVARLQGGNTSDYVNTDINEYSNLGFRRSQVLQGRAGIIRTLGRDSSSDLRSLLAIQKGFDVSQDELLGVSRLGRGDSSFNLNRVFTSLYSGLQYSGLGKERTEAFIPEYLKLLTEIGQEQLTTLGKVDIGVNTRLITALSGESRLQNPETLKSVISGITQGLSNAKTPQVEAAQFSTLARLFPEKSLWELEKIREAPFQKGNEAYLSEFMKDLQNRTSGREDFERTVSQVFGIKKNLAGSVIDAMSKGNFDLLKKEITPQITEQDVYTRATNAIDRFETAISKFEDLKIGELTSAINNGFDNLLNTLNTAAILKKSEVFRGQGPIQSELMNLAIAPFINKIIK